MSKNICTINFYPPHNEVCSNSLNVHLATLPAPLGEDSDSGDYGTTTLTRPEQKTQEPKRYRVLLLNDDFTPMDFVVHVLIKFFKKTPPEAEVIMMQVHHEGAGLCGVFPHEIAETKVFLVNEYAKNHEHPLRCTMEEEC